jgi:hypothetical protein
VQQHNLSARVRSVAARRALVGAVFASVVAASPAIAAEGPQGVRTGHNITVFHNIDMIAAFGSSVGEQTQVDVFRGAHRIATARGAAVETPEGGALEVNHGPEGPAVAGDCWDGATPDIRPGDRIVVSNPGGAAGVDEAIVDNLAITSRTVVTRDADTGGEVVVIPGTPETPESPAVPETTEPTREEVWLEGVAEYIDANGVATPMPIEALDSAEFLGVPDDNQLRMAPNEVVAGATPGTFIAKYYDEDPEDSRAGFNIDRNRNNRNDDYIFNAVATGEGHAMGYGHVEILPPVSMLVDGLDEQLTAAPGCEAAPKLASSLGTASTDVLSTVNVAPGGADPVLTLGGWAAAGVTEAKVVLTSGDTVVEKAVDLAADATRQQGWGASFTAAELEGLAEGDVRAQLSIGDVLVGAVKTIRYDVTPPELSVDLSEGTYTGAQRVVVTAGAAGDTITYALNGGPARPYTGGAIELGVGDHVLVVRSTDTAGNSTERTFAYTVNPAPAPVKETGGSDAGSRQLQAHVAPTEQAAQAPVTITPTAPGIDRITAPRSVKLAKARKGVGIMISTKAASIAAKADKGAKVVAFARPPAGYKLVFKAKRKGAYKVTVRLPGGATSVVALKVR